MRSKHLDDRLIPCFIVAFQLSAQFRHVRHQKIRITLRQVLAPFGLHRQRQFQQFGLKMVERELLIVKRPSVGKGSSASNSATPSAPETAKTRARPMAPNASSLSASCTIFASGVVGAFLR